MLSIKIPPPMDINLPDVIQNERRGHAVEQ
jgi:hypothetical protein